MSNKTKQNKTKQKKKENMQVSAKVIPYRSAHTGLRISKWSLDFWSGKDPV
jgi:hypothetical protein